MSHRLGMADGRCFTVQSSAQLLNNHIMKSNGISLEDNYSFRQLLQKPGPTVMDPVQAQQGSGKCITCDTPLLKTPSAY